ncbi:hypothetical protein [Streptococcus sobrinus]|uniref:hypothetical protein n=1 Tax=Streptococcus sobrinus TaxID=1310 RepID=UPI0002D7E981|nr:hypothetical protein [Streptococcus sobrinus]
MNGILNDITKSFNSYNKTVNKEVVALNKSLIAVAVVITGVLFLLEMLSWVKYFKSNNGEMTWKFFLEVAYKYIIALFFIYNSGIIADSILYVANVIAKLAGANLSDDVFKFNLAKKGNFIVRGAINIMGFFVGGVAVLISKILVLMRFVELYVLKAVAPIFIAFMMNDETKSIAYSFFRRLAAVAFQGALIILLLVIWQKTSISDAVNYSKASWLGYFATPMSYLAKCIVFIILMVGTQRLSKSLFQAN